jgi:hypothetical protein
VAHANFHIAAGIAVGTALTALPVLRAWRGERPLARPIARLLLVSYGLAFWAAFVAHYLLVLAALRRAQRRTPPLRGGYVSTS